MVRNQAYIDQNEGIYKKLNKKDDKNFSKGISIKQNQTIPKQISQELKKYDMNLEHENTSCFHIADLYRRRMFQLLVSAYSTISVHDTAQFLGMNEEEVTVCKFLY